MFVVTEADAAAIRAALVTIRCPQVASGPLPDSAQRCRSKDGIEQGSHGQTRATEP
jgi:hypothetical protein